MRKILFIVIAIVAFCGSLQAQYDTEIKLTISKTNACLEDVIELHDNTWNNRTIARHWFFEDTIIEGHSVGDQITIFRKFTQETNPVELHVVYATPDTIVAHEGDTILSSRLDTVASTSGNDSVIVAIDTIVASEGEEIHTLHFDTIKGYDTVYVFIHPDMTASGDTMVCAKGITDIVMSPTKDNVNYTWFEQRFDDGMPIAYGNRLQVAPYSNSALYFIKASNDIGCAIWDSTRAYIVSNTLTMIPASGNICEGDAAYLIAGQAESYLWESLYSDTSLVGKSKSSQVEVHPAVGSNVYSVTLYGNGGCSGEQLFATVTVHPYPVQKLQVTPNYIDVENPTVELADLSTGNDYSFWQFGAGDYAEGTTITHTFSNLRDDSMSVTLRSTNSIGCHVDTTIMIPVQPFASWAPNVFTPNRSENSTFRIRTVNALEYFSIYIYNRSGALVYTSTDPQFSWDGTHNDQDCPQGVYVYICNYRKPGTDILSKMKGTVLLLR